MHAFAEVFWVLSKWVVSGKETFTVLINDATKSTWTFRAAEGSLCRKQVKIKARCPERITELSIYRWAQEEQRHFPKHQSPWIAGKDRGYESFDACVMLEVFLDGLYSLTAGVHIMREQSSGFGSVSEIVIQLRWFDLVLGFLCPLSCQVNISEGIYACNGIFRKYN